MYRLSLCFLLVLAIFLGGRLTHSQDIKSEAKPQPQKIDPSAKKSPKEPAHMLVEEVVGNIVTQLIAHAPPWEKTKMRSIKIIYEGNGLGWAAIRSVKDGTGRRIVVPYGFVI